MRTRPVHAQRLATRIRDLAHMAGRCKMNSSGEQCEFEICSHAFPQGTTDELDGEVDPSCSRVSSPRNTKNHVDPWCPGRPPLVGDDGANFPSPSHPVGRQTLNLPEAHGQPCCKRCYKLQARSKIAPTFTPYREAHIALHSRPVGYPPTACRRQLDARNAALRLYSLKKKASCVASTGLHSDIGT